MNTQTNIAGKTTRYTVKSNIRQRGIALPLTLILLLAMTLIAVATLRTTTLEENMTANTRLRQIAFNAAETAIREAEGGVAELIREEKRKNSGLRALIFDRSVTEPRATVPNADAPGDVCEAGPDGGYCTPAIHTFVDLDAGETRPEDERWADATLDVWNDDARHMVFENLANSGLEQEGVVEPAKFIVEFMGNYDYKELNVTGELRPTYAGAFTGPCRDSSNNELTPPNNEWPYCAADAQLFRITARATAGPRARQAEVILQSIFRYTGD